jgi:calcineurin-like phosphoesterase family protein
MHSVDVLVEQTEVYILGDFTLRSAEEAHKYLTRLNGRKYFIMGNHDKFLRGGRFDKCAGVFEWVKDYEMLYIESQCFVLFHYPILEWANYYRGSIHVHGHVHNRNILVESLNSPARLAFNAGVDVNGFRPVSITEILRKSGKKIAE